MKLVTLLASSAALAAIAVVVPATISSKWNPVASAEAATSISFSVFYDGLADHGDWVDHDGDYVFVPVVSNRDWRPYREGHWIYARQHGWTWVSDEPFGWATYHYGRWGFNQEIGWYWKPGSKWAPAWVSWRRTGDHVAWAPLPPRRGGGDDLSISVSIGSIPDYYWVAVPTRSFLEVNLSVVIIDDDRERRRIVRDSEFVGSVNIQNNIVVNNVIDVNFVEKNTGKEVKEVAVKESNDPASAKTSDGEVAMFNGTVEPDKSAKPPKLKKAGEVKQNQAENKKKIQSETEGQAATPAPDVNTEDTAKTGENETDDTKKKLTPEQAEAEGEPTEAPATEQAAQPDDKKKKVTSDQAGSEPAEAPATEQAAQPDTKKKKVTPEQAEGAAPEAPATEQAAQPDKKKKLPEQAEGTAADDMPVGSITKPDQKAKKEKAGETPATKKAVPCDPAVENCENPQQ